MKLDLKQEKNISAVSFMTRVRNVLKTKRAKDHIAGYLFSAPAVALFLAIGIFTLFLSIFLGFVTWEGKISTSRWVWLEHFKTFIGGENPTIQQAYIDTMIHTFIVAFVTISIIVPTALILAFLVNRISGKLVGVYRTIFFLPMVCSGVAIYAMWRTMFHSKGLVNAFLEKIGLSVLSQPEGWLGNTSTAMGAVIVTVIWSAIPGVLILYYAGLKTVDNELYESADIDGAKMHHKLMYITWPLLKPITALVTVQLLSGAFQMFENIWVLTEGGPAGATEVAGTLIYKIAFRNYIGGSGNSLASAMGWVTFLITLILSYIVVRVFNTDKDTEGVKK